MKHLYFLGICGTAMGSVAAAFRELGYEVSGSDAGVYPPMSTFLEEKGIRLLDGFDASHITDDVDLYVVGNAMSRGNPEVEALLDRKLPFVSMPDLLEREVLQGRRNFVVTGTHGKTTTTSILAWIFESAGKNPSFLIGGVPANFSQGARFRGREESEIVVLEGDEYDTAFFDKRSKFFHYLPEVVVMNNLEFDHADIFENLDAIKLSFSRMLRLVPRNGCIFANGDDANVLAVAHDQDHTPVVTVGTSSGCDRIIEDIEYGADGSSFTLVGERYTIPMAGEYNVRNAAMAVVSSLFGGLTPGEIRGGLLSFSGIKRRMELRGEERGVKVVDDFAHHPTALKQAIEAVKQRYPGSKVWALFEPRSNTASQNFFQHDFVHALLGADVAVVADVADKEKFVDGVRLDASKVVEDVNAAGTRAILAEDADAIVSKVVPEVGDGDVLAVFSNGGFGGIHDKLLNALRS